MDNETMKTKRYSVAPNVTAQLCGGCWLTTLHFTKLGDAHRQRMAQDGGVLHLTHREYADLVPHRACRGEETR